MYPQKHKARLWCCYLHRSSNKDFHEQQIRSSQSIQNDVNDELFALHCLCFPNDYHLPLLSFLPKMDEQQRRCPSILEHGEQERQRCVEIHHPSLHLLGGVLLADPDQLVRDRGDGEVVASAYCQQRRENVLCRGHELRVVPQLWLDRGARPSGVRLQRQDWNADPKQDGVQEVLSGRDNLWRSHLGRFKEWSSRKWGYACFCLRVNTPAS